MADNDMMVLEDAQDALFTLTKAYRKAMNDNNLNDMATLKPQVDAASDAYSDARLKLLEAGVLATADDMAEMRRVKGEIDAAANTQQIIQGAIQLVGLLRKFIV